jgi:hypothetical protein
VPPRAWFAVELVAIAVIAIAPVPLPAACVLVVASVSLWARGKSWLVAAPAPPELIPIGVVCGAVALALAQWLSVPIEIATGRMVEWTQYTIVRGSPQAFVMVAVVVGAQAIAIEMALRGWLVPRVIDLFPVGGAAIAIAVSGLAEAAITPGHLMSRLGAYAIGAGSALLFLGAGRRLAAPIACRLTFELGAVLLAALRIV